MKYIFTILFFVSVVSISGQTELQYSIDSVVVTTSRVPQLLRESGRSLEIISKKRLDYLPAENIQDILKFSSGIDLKQRGPGGMQADLSIRGSSFEQTLVLIDGIKLSDPQTGHHNMNLPISLAQIERIEILKGQGSQTYGANAFGGIVNIIPNYNQNSSLSFRLSGGENNFFNLGMSASLKLGNTHHNISIDNSKSDGYRHNTEFNKLSLSMTNSYNLKSAVIKTILGYNNKEFGANSYYTIRFPNQAEETKTILAAASAEVQIDDYSLSPKIYWRKNDDDFVLDKLNPEFYHNKHHTNVYGGELQLSTNNLGGSSIVGIEYSLNSIESNNLGEHKRETTGFFVEQNFKAFTNFNISLGGYAYHYSQLNWKFWPGLDIAFRLNKYITLYGNYGRAFRIPTYTELYYSDPVTKGNSDLKPEESDNFELGFNFENDYLKFHSALFRRQGKNLIDYVLDTSDDFWKAKNFTKIITNGIEFILELPLRQYTYNIVDQLNVNYTYLDSDKENFELVSRYTIEHLKHDVKLTLFNVLPFGIYQSWIFNYEKRFSMNDVLIVDTKFSKNIENINLYLNASNVFDKIYEDIPGVKLPGRWIIFGINIKI